MLYTVDTVNTINYNNNTNNKAIEWFWNLEPVQVTLLFNFNLIEGTLK